MKAFVVGPRAEMSSDLHSLINCISERAAEVEFFTNVARNRLVFTNVAPVARVIFTNVAP